MATLTGTKINDTFDGLLKTSDNTPIGATPKTITDGIGNLSGLALDTSGNVYVDNDLDVSGDVIVSGRFYDGTSSAGTSGQLLSSTGSSTDWITFDVNISNTPSSTNVLVESSRGTDTTIAAATTSLAGVMSAADKTKLDGIEAGAEVNVVDSVNSQTGAVVLDADDIDDSATTNKFTTASDISKLAGIEAGADVTDATNVAAAGAMMTGVALLNDLADVSGNPADGEVLTYNASLLSWVPATGGSSDGEIAYTISVISTNTTAVKDYLYVATDSLTLTLPSGPIAGDRVGVSNMSGTTTLTIGRNGENIQGLAEDLTFNVAGYGLQLFYTGATKGWVII